MIYAITTKTGETYNVGTAADAAAVAIAGAKQRCRDDIVAVYPTTWQLNAANGLRTEAEVVAMRSHILAASSLRVFFKSKANSSPP